MESSCVLEVGGPWRQRGELAGKGKEATEVAQEPSDAQLDEKAAEVGSPRRQRDEAAGKGKEATEVAQEPSEAKLGEQAAEAAEETQEPSKAKLGEKAAEAAVASESQAGAAAKPRKRKLEAQAGGADGAEEAKPKASKAEAPCLVVYGLGSQGPGHTQQRHNLGARAVEELAKRLKTEALPSCEGAQGVLRMDAPGRPKLLLPPQGEINDSGPLLQASLGALGHPSAAFLAIVDDCALPLGTLRLRAKGSSGGHNGLKSIEATFGSDYHRLKLGIGGQRTKEHVVGVFEPGVEAETARLMAERAAEAAELWLTKGPEAVQDVMAKVNAPSFRQVAVAATGAALRSETEGA